MKIYLTDEQIDRIIALLEISVTVVSIIFLYKGYVLAKEYLEQHKQKIKAERDRFSVEETIRNV